MVWPVIFVIWGALTATGFVILPKPRRFLGFFFTTSSIAAFFEVLLPRTGIPEPSFGFGGLIGNIIEKSFVPRFGFGGTLIVLGFVSIVSLVLSGNLTISRTKEFAQMGVYYVRRFFRKFWTYYFVESDTVAVARSGSMNKSGHDIVIEESRKRAPRSNKEQLLDADGQNARPAAPVAAKSGLQLQLYYDGPVNNRPDASLFTKTKMAPDRSKDFKIIADNLVTQLAEFKINGEIKGVTQGPVVTTFEFKPAPGTKVSKISALGEDLARLLKAQSLRVLAPIPGKDTVGFEVPNTEKAIIGFHDLVAAKEFSSSKRKLPIAMGVDIFGQPVIEDLAEMPHLLVAGSTGSGKSVFMNTLIGSLIARHTAATLRFVMIDPKMVEMAAYNDLPHMACPVITDPQADAKNALGQLVNEMEDRFRKMHAVGARNIDSFNEIVKTRKKSEFINFEGRWAPMPFIVLIIDEMADMMMLLGKDAETPITRLAQKARAAGIHMVIATQRPSADVITGLIKANFPTRVAFRVLSGIDSRTILDQSGAETLLGKGDMLYLASGGCNRMHGAYLSEKEVQEMVKVSKKAKGR
jgi:S-DNA-T family DNA segregation ATPase FtsK/SpoIIIE